IGGGGQKYLTLSTISKGGLKNKDSMHWFRGFYR
ncbi:unnamed protein product, partial [marine sediment metagenome]